MTEPKKPIAVIVDGNKGTNDNARQLIDVLRQLGHEVAVFSSSEWDTKKMSWGDQYKVVVCTHVSDDNVTLVRTKKRLKTIAARENRSDPYHLVVYDVLTSRAQRELPKPQNEGVLPALTYFDSSTNDAKTVAQKISEMAEGKIPDVKPPSGLVSR